MSKYLFKPSDIKQHWLDYTRQADLSKADKKCKHCYGGGVVGKVFAQGRAKFKNGVFLVCRCVPKPVQEEPKKDA